MYSDYSNIVQGHWRGTGRNTHLLFFSLWDTCGSAFGGQPYEKIFIEEILEKRKRRDYRILKRPSCHYFSAGYADQHSPDGIDKRTDGVHHLCCRESGCCTEGFFVCPQSSI